MIRQKNKLKAPSEQLKSLIADFLMSIIGIKISYGKGNVQHLVLFFRTIQTVQSGG